MRFDNWQSVAVSGEDISSSLLWEYNLSDFDWEQMKTLVVQRVIERGWEKDWYAAIHKYGGLAAFIDIVKQVPYLSDRDMNYVSVLFNIDKKELRCYKLKQSREERLKSFNS